MIGVHPLRETDFLGIKVDISKRGDVRYGSEETTVHPRVQDQGCPSV